MKTRIIVLLAVSVLSSIVVFVASSYTTHATRYNNDFIRIFPSHAGDLFKTIRLDRPRLTLAGASDNSVFLQSGQSLIELSMDMLDTCQRTIENYRSNDLIIQDSFFYVQNGTSRAIQRGNIQTLQIDTTYRTSTDFTAIQPISKTSFILQVIDVKARKSIFTSSNSPTLRKDVLTTQVDGILCTDGILQYSPGTSVLVYTYRYRNQFLCMDTSLNVLRIGKTIDTTSVAKIAVSEVGGRIQMSAPPFVVNRTTAVDGKHLYINSNLVAKNESTTAATDRSVIDVYNILDASYRFSFYVYNVDNAKMRAFIVRDTILFAVFPKHVARYDLASRYLRN